MATTIKQAVDFLHEIPQCAQLRLSDFRVGQGAFLDQLLTDTIAALMHQRLAKLEDDGWVPEPIIASRNVGGIPVYRGLS